MKGRRLYDEGGIVANTILQQLGGASRLRMMTGAYNFVDLKNGLSFRIKNQRANFVKITLTSMDLYDVEIGRVRGDQYKVVAESKGMYNDQLKPFIEKATGMYLSLYEKGGDVDDAPMSDHQMKNYLIEKGISAPAMVNGKYCPYWEDAAEELGFVRNDAGWEEEEDEDFDEIHDANYFDEGDEDEDWDEDEDEMTGERDGERRMGEDFAKGGEISDSDIEKFVDYVYSFYGVEDGIYKDDDDLNGGATKEEIREAVKMYMADLSAGKDGMEWGDGDSIDRERIRVYLGKRNFNHEIVVVAKGLEKDGGQIITERYLVNAGSEDEAKKIAESMWREEGMYSDFHISEVLTDEQYRSKYFEKGGIVRYVSKGDNSGNLYFRRYNNAIGSFGWSHKEGSSKKIHEGILYALNEFDKDFYSHLKLKDGEFLFRYRTDVMLKGWKFLIKINIEKALLYFMTNWEDDKNPEFSTKGVKADYILLERDSFAKGGEVKVGDEITANTGVKVKVIEYDPKFGGRVKVLRLDEHSDGKPSQFMPLSRFKFSYGGMPMTAGKYYRDASGDEFRFIGDTNGVGLFTDKDGKGVKKEYSEFSKAPKESKLFGWFEHGGTIDEYRMLEQKLEYLEEMLNETEDEYDKKRIKSQISSIQAKMVNIEDSYEKGGEIKWQDVEVGDSARVKEINKTGLIMQAYGRKFHLKFPDGTEKTYDAKELEFFKDEFGKGGRVKKKRVRFVDKVNAIAERLEGTKVPKRLRKDYGVRYNQMEAEEAGRRIAGAYLRDKKMTDGGDIEQKLNIALNTETGDVYVGGLKKKNILYKDDKGYFLIDGYEKFMNKKYPIKRYFSTSENEVLSAYMNK